LTFDKQPNSRYCFLCGRENPIGLKMSWFNDHEHNQIWSKLVVPDEFNSYPGIMHGGMSAAHLDDNAGQGVLLTGDIKKLRVKAKLEIRYRKPTPTGEEIMVVGWIERESRGRAKVAGEIRLSDGTVTAECEALIVKPPAEYLAGFDTNEWYVDNN